MADEKTQAAAPAAPAAEKPAAPAPAPAEAPKTAKEAAPAPEVEAPQAGVYVLKIGKHSAIIEGQHRDFAIGDEVELTAEQAASFGDKFELKG